MAVEYIFRSPPLPCIGGGEAIPIPATGEQRSELEYLAGCYIIVQCTCGQTRVSLEDNAPT